VGARFSTPVQTGSGTQTASCTMGTGSFPGVKSGRGVTLTRHPLLVLWSRNSRATPLLPVWAVRPVHSLIACTRVHFTHFISLSVEVLVYIILKCIPVRGVVVKALRYLSEGPGIDPRSLGIFSEASDSSMCPGVGSASKNEYQDIPGSKDGRCVRVTTLPPSCAECLEILEP